MIRVHVYRSEDVWWPELVSTEPIPHTINNPTPRPTWAEAVADAERAWALLG